MTSYIQRCSLFLLLFTWICMSNVHRSYLLRYAQDLAPSLCMTLPRLRWHAHGRVNIDFTAVYYGWGEIPLWDTCQTSRSGRFVHKLNRKNSLTAVWFGFTEIFPPIANDRFFPVSFPVSLWKDQLAIVNRPRRNKVLFSRGRTVSGLTTKSIYSEIDIQFRDGDYGLHWK